MVSFLGALCIVINQMYNVVYVTHFRLALEIMRGKENRFTVPDIVVLLTDGYDTVNPGMAVPVAEQLLRV